MKHHIERLFWFISVLFVSIPVANAQFSFNTNCQKAYQHIISLRLHAAKELIEQEKRVLPENDFIPLLENYYDYIYLLCSDDKALFDQLKKKKSDRLARLASAESDSPYFLWAQAEVNLQWALLRGRYGEYLSSALEIKKANGLLQESIKSFPDFSPSRKAMGMVQSILGSLPAGAQTALGTLGVRGNTAQGQKMLEETAKNLSQSIFYDETVFYLAHVYTNISKEPNSYQKIALLCRTMDDKSLLKTYILAQSAMKTGNSAKAIGLLESKPNGTAYTPYPYLTYLLAIAKMNCLDKGAKELFLQFVKENKQRSYTKDAYLRLAWSALLEGDESSYQKHIHHVKTQGSAHDEKDKQALHEANDAPPHIELLKARLLYDGGYYLRAKQCLTRLDPNKMPLLRDKIEFCYRYARIFHDTENMANALKFYRSAIDLGSHSNYYYAANAALLSGNIYEKQKNHQQAALFYQKAIDMKNHQYESSIENKAKEGLNRLKGKL